ncbi:unnamed protein product, partial [Candidula unifasciata]
MDDFGLCLSGDKFSAVPMGRRNTIHGSEIRKENAGADVYNVRRPGGKNRGKCCSSTSTVAGNSTTSSIVSQTRQMGLTDVVRGTLRRRVSTSLLKHKLKKLQDYSLPHHLDNFALLRETCNVKAAGTSNILKKHKTPPPKPPRQNLPTNSKGNKSLPAGKQHNQELITDHDLQQKIDHEIKMREGTARLLVASKHPAQVLEAAKNLLSSNTRIIAYMSELQRRKTAEVLGKTLSHEGNQLPCKAQVSVSDIRIPLMWKDADHFKNKGDYRRYAVFCMLKVGTEIYDTSMISDVDRSMTDITFEDVILFDDVPHDFEMKLEVYCHKLHEEFSVANTPKKLRKKINDISGSVGRSVGKRLSGLNDSEVIGNMVLGPKFELVARGSLNLADVDKSVRTFDLQLETTADGQVHELPLFGHYCCRLAALPNCLVRATVTGYLNLQ